MLSTIGLTKRYRGRAAVEDLSLTVPDGAFFAVLGPNGAGKTTLVRMLCGLLAPDAGDVLHDGTPIRKDPLAWRRLIGVMPEDLCLFDRLSFDENAALCAEVYGIPRAEAEARRDELFSFLDLREHGGLQAAEGSQGMRKKLALALALIHAPRCLFLDEPVNGLDVASVRAVKDLFALLARRRVTVVVTSHLTDLLEGSFTHAAVVDGGRLAALSGAAALRGAGLTLEEFYLRSVSAPRREIPAFPWLG